MGSRELQQQYHEMSEQFQADINASVVHYDEPHLIAGHQMYWEVTMDRDEYRARENALGALGDAVKVAAGEEVQLQADLMIYGD